MTDDATLLRRYAAEKSGEAFAELVRRHLPLVYSAALRRLGGDAHRAEDVAQVVFCALAQKAHRLSDHTVLPGWLYVATRNAVLNVIRAEKRRRTREEEAHLMHEISHENDRSADWSQLRPVLDAAMDRLSARDREAVLLRFFQGLPFAEIGEAIGLSEDAARKRVDRALDKLRDVLRPKGVASTSAALAALLGQQTLAAAPAPLAASVSGVALAAAGSASLGGLGATLAISKLKLGLAAGVTAAVFVGGFAVRHAAAAFFDRDDTSASEVDPAPDATLGSLVAVPVQLGPSYFRDGDSIVVRQVHASSPRMEAGDRVVVRGTYQLNSHPTASLGLSLTTLGPSGALPVDPASRTRITAGSGTFQLSVNVANVGCLHLTFSTPEGKSVGTVYFGTPEQVQRVSRMDMSSFAR